MALVASILSIIEFISYWILFSHIYYHYNKGFARIIMERTQIQQKNRLV